MSRGTHWLAGAALAALLSVTPALASGHRTLPSAEAQVQVVLPPAQPLTALGAAPLSAEAGQLRSYQMARAPVGTLSNATLLPATSQAVGFQVSKADGGQHRLLTWAAAGAAIGAIWGLIDEDPVEKALIGGVVGAGLSFVVRH